MIYTYFQSDGHGRINKENNTHNVVILSSVISRYNLRSSYHLYSFRAAVHALHFFQLRLGAQLRVLLTFTDSLQSCFLFCFCFSWLSRNVIQKYYLDVHTKDRKYLQICHTLQIIFVR